MLRPVVLREVAHVAGRVRPANQKHLRVALDHVARGRIVLGRVGCVSVVIGEGFCPGERRQAQDVNIAKGRNIDDRQWDTGSSSHIAVE
jgi:hypothetical protein